MLRLRVFCIKSESHIDNGDFALHYAVAPECTHYFRENITVQLTFCLTGFELTALHALNKPQIYLFFLKIGLFPASSVFTFVFSKASNKYVEYKILPMTRFESRTFGIGSDSSANCPDLLVWSSPNQLNSEVAHKVRLSMERSKRAFS